MKTEPSFYLDITETGAIDELRKCWELGRYSDGVRNDYMLVKVEPPIPLGNEDSHEMEVGKILLATRHEGTTLYPTISAPPLFVYVIRLKSDRFVGSGEFDPNDVELAMWGVVYKTRKDAETVLRAPSPSR